MKLADLGCQEVVVAKTVVAVGLEVEYEVDYAREMRKRHAGECDCLPCMACLSRLFRRPVRSYSCHGGMPVSRQPREHTKSLGI
jgi:hypothetical protein